MAVNYVDTHPALEPAFGRWLALDLLVGGAAIVTSCFRRRAPLAVAVSVGVASGVSTLAFGSALLTLTSLATRRRYARIGLAGTLTALATFGGALLLPNFGGDALPMWALVTGSAVGTAIPILLGLNIGSRRELLAAYKERAEAAERDRAGRIDRARAEERARIAHEMHDVLAHRLSLVTMHSGALAYRTDLTPSELADTSETIRANAHQALTELREVLGALRPDDSAGDRAPQPTLARLSELVRASGDAGNTVEVRLDDECADLIDTVPDATGRHAFRIVQESLTNARKHAPGAAVTVEIGGSPGPGLSVRVTNRTALPDDDRGGGSPAGMPASGLGIAGMTERARLAGGSLTAGSVGDPAGGPSGGTVFVVRAWLPWRK